MTETSNFCFKKNYGYTWQDLRWPKSYILEFLDHTQIDTLIWHVKKIKNNKKLAISCPTSAKNASLMYSHLNYNVCWYASTYDTHLNKLFLLQKRDIRIINNVTFHSHTDPLFFSNGILKIHDIHKLNIGLYMYDHEIPTHFIRSHNYHTRGSSDLLPGQARLTSTLNSLSVVGPNIWNTIPEDIKNSASRNSFKFKYKRHLLSFYSSNQTWLTSLSHTFLHITPCLYPLFASGSKLLELILFCF